MRVLLVEDDEHVQVIMLRLFAPWQVEVAATVDKAIELLRSRDFDAVVSDYNLIGPKHGGHLLLWVRDNKPELVNSFVFVSGNPDAGKYGQPFIPKPARVDLIKEELVQRRKSLFDIPPDAKVVVGGTGIIVGDEELFKK